MGLLQAAGFLPGHEITLSWLQFLSRFSMHLSREINQMIYSKNNLDINVEAIILCVIWYTKSPVQGRQGEFFRKAIDRPVATSGRFPGKGLSPKFQGMFI